MKPVLYLVMAVVMVRGSNIRNRPPDIFCYPLEQDLGAMWWRIGY
jgi:hypothetical protein